ncbi:MAG: hypothetical protein EOM20_16870 [Spartobacteria bacterium]|nr:hypothetical protein [Spartobacteria bacterium]
MKKLTVLCMDADRDAALEELRALGVVHLDHIQAPEGSEVDEARNAITTTQRVLERLVGETDKDASGLSPAEIVQKVSADIEEHKNLSAHVDALNLERIRIEPFGNFDPASIEKLAAEGIFVKLFRIGAKDTLTIPDNAACELLRQTKEARFYMVVSTEDVELDAPSFRLPAQSLKAINEEIGRGKTRLAEIDKELADMARDHAAVAEFLKAEQDRLTYAEARAGMGVQAVIAYLRGYCPVSDVEAIRKAATKHGWGLVIDEPAGDDQVPTKITNPRWIEPIKSIFDITGIIPGYNEMDISPSFLIFLSIFFAMLVGDAGYGVVFILLTRWARKKMPKAPAYPFTFLYIMSWATVVWGILTGTYFGIEAWKRDALVPWLNDDNNMMLLCFLIGAVHLTVAHLWSAFRMINRPQALAQLGWVCMTWTMFFVAQIFVLGKDISMKPVMILAGVGAVLIILFMTPPKKLKEEWFNHAMLPLSIISNFTDVVSYLRLFAVGTASYAVASAFNTMLAPMFGHVLSTFVGALFLFLGHALNIALCGLGILVHGVRLNTLEFSSHIGLQWTGHEYEPFARKSKQLEEQA